MAIQNSNRTTWDISLHVVRTIALWTLRDSRSQTVLAVGIFLFSVLLTFGGPEVGANEGVYLVKSRQLVDSNFLAADWTFERETSSPHGLLFSALIAPFWKTELTPIQVIFILRAILWAAFAAATIAFLRSQDLPVLPAFVGMSIWVLEGQFLLAGEWLVGGAEQKTLAYIALLMALANAMKSRWISMSLWLSVSIWFHILVGGWAAVATFMTLLARPAIISRLQWLKSAAITGILTSPAIVLAASAILRDRVPAEISTIPIPFESAAQMMVQFRAAHHLDPSYFVSASGFSALLMFIAGVTASFLVLPIAGNRKQLLAGFLIITGMIAAAGLLAHATAQYWFLHLYPFRLADGMLPFFSCLLLPIALLTSLFGVSNVSKSKVWILGIVAAALSLWAAPRIYYNSISAAKAWGLAAKQATDGSRSELYDWIRTDTRSDAVFLAPPWWGDFLLSAERSMLVSIRAAPQNAKAREWYQRLEIANNFKPLERNIYQAIPALRTNYHQISMDHLACIVSTFGTDYYIAESKREDLNDLVVFNVGTNYAYDIASIPLNSVSCQLVRLQNNN